MSRASLSDLDRLPSLAELFALLNSGRHLNRLLDVALWSELQREQEAYSTLFERLGYALKIDERGFAWFHFDEGSAALSKASRQLALLCLLIFEMQADSGRQLSRFTEWRVDRALFSSIIDSHRPLLEAEGVADVDALAAVIKTAVSYGFAEVDGTAWRLLPAVHRYLDAFESLVQPVAIGDPSDDDASERVSP